MKVRGGGEWWRGGRQELAGNAFAANICLGFLVATLLALT